MSKLLGLAAGATVIVGAAVIASLVLNVITYVHMNDGEGHHHKTTLKPTPSHPTRSPASTDEEKTTTTTRRTTTTTTSTTTSTTTEPSPVPPQGNILCPNVGVAENTPAWQEAAEGLLSVMDESVDPCEDFYSFSCNKFIETIDLDDHDGKSFSTNDEAQHYVLSEAVSALNMIDVTDNNTSQTEKIVKIALDSCVNHYTDTEPQIKPVEHVLKHIAKYFGGIPFLNHTLKKDFDLYQAMATLERAHTLGTFLSSSVSVNYKDSRSNRLYISQPSLPMPREFYVLPQFNNELEARVTAIKSMLSVFADEILNQPSRYWAMISDAAEMVVKMEVQLAKASWSDSEMSNHARMYNSYDLNLLEKMYPNIGWKRYIDSLLSSVEGASAAATKHVILVQPSYFGFLNTLFDGNIGDPSFVNFMIIQLLFEEADFLGGKYAKIADKANYVHYIRRNGRGVNRVSQPLSTAINGDSDPTVYCMRQIMDYMPFGPGYVYVKSKQNRDKVIPEIKELTKHMIVTFLEMLASVPWMTRVSLQAAMNKASELRINLGWPTEMFGDFRNFSALDYSHIIELRTKNCYYDVLNVLRSGYENRENFRLLTQPAKGDQRNNFLYSPALVNAWYQPERNSITLPYALWNPPYFNIDYPLAYNYAGLGATLGHELVHLIDDQGAQFGPKGRLSKCTWYRCGWMDDSTRESFSAMNQCLVSQYSTECCCPMKNESNYCASGMNSQAENVADIAGVQAAQHAYLQLVQQLGKEEKRLPGLERYSPEQLFWISYGNTMCVKQSASDLRKKIAISSYAPNSCRTNQAAKNIPEFARQFECRAKQKMYLEPDQRCKVLIGF
ncbi:hypothetical protein Q1695_000985 [Nippostrongylus brasiliensis]|nr:hypothetical protein Q1695_000985 [Nippostrongylus brasiliensis]